MPVERGLRATSPVHVHVEDDIPVHVHVKQKGKKVTKKVYVIYTLASIKKIVDRCTFCNQNDLPCFIF